MQKKKYVSPAVYIQRVKMEVLVAQTATARVQNNLQYTDYSEYPAAADETTQDLWIVF
jgi:hypothetical protein